MKLPGNRCDGLMMMKNLLGGTTLERGVLTRRNLFRHTEGSLLRHGRLLEREDIVTENSTKPLSTKNPNKSIRRLWK